MSEILCPACQLPMREKNLAGLAFSQCQKCDGVWISRSTLLEFRGLDFEKHPLFFQEDLPPIDDHRHLACPLCGHDMHAFDYRGSNTIVDQCPLCNHFFLDAGELGNVLEDWKKRPHVEESDPNPSTSLSIGYTDGPSALALASLIFGMTLLFVSTLMVWKPVQYAMWIASGLLFVVAAGRWAWFGWRLKRGKKELGSKSSLVAGNTTIRGVSTDYRTAAPERKVESIVEGKNEQR